MLENYNTNIVIYLKINQKLFRGQSMITHLYKFGYEERQKQLKKKKQQNCTFISHLQYDEKERVKVEKKHKNAYMVPTDMQIRHESNSYFTRD